MFDSLHRLIAPAMVERATLLANHVIAAEPVALGKLQAHRGKQLRFAIDGLPGWLPAPPPLAFAITPAGLLEWVPEAQGADLVLRISAEQAGAIATQVLAGQRPPVQIEGDALLAADVGWLIENLRWDLAADLERFLPPALVQLLVQLGRSLRAGLHGLLSGLPPR